MSPKKPSEILQESVKNARQVITEDTQKLLDAKSQEILKTSKDETQKLLSAKSAEILKTSKEVTKNLLDEKSKDILKIVKQLSEELGSRNIKINYLTWALILNLLFTAILFLLIFFQL